MTVVASTVDTLYEQAVALLAVAETALADTDAGAPDDAYVTLDEPAYDCCPALIVHVRRLGEEVTSPATPPGSTALRPKIGGVILATYVITVLRCAAQMSLNGDPPSPAAQQAVAATVLADGFALWNGVTHAFNDGDIFDSCYGFHRDDMVPVRDRGGCVGWEWAIRPVIPGIPNT